MLDSKIALMESLAAQLIETQGKLSPGKISLYVQVGKFGAAISGGVIKIGLPPQNPPFYDSRRRKDALGSLTHKLVDEVIAAFRGALVLDDLAAI